MSELQDVVDLMFLHFTDSNAGKGRIFFVCVVFLGFPPPPFLFLLILQVVFHPAL